MRAVSNTSPINYLVQIDEIETLPKLYGKIIIPNAVMTELQDVGSPAAVRNWAAGPPAWSEVSASVVGSALKMTNLGAGESDAILLAQKIGADVLILDDRAAAMEAQNRGLLVTGTLGVLAKAAKLGFVDLTKAIHRLLATNFRVRRSLVDTLLKE